MSLLSEGGSETVLAASIVLAFNRPVVRALLLIILFSVSLSYLVAPLALRMRLRYRAGSDLLKTALAVLLIYLALFVLGIAAWGLAAAKWQGQLSDVRARIPTYPERARQLLDTVERFANRLSPPEPYAIMVRQLSLAAFALVKIRTGRLVEEMTAGRSLLPWLWLVPANALLLISCFSRFRDSAGPICLKDTCAGEARNSSGM